MQRAGGRPPLQLRLPGLQPRDLAAGAADAESPVDVRALASTPLTPDRARARKLELPLPALHPPVAAAAAAAAAAASAPAGAALSQNEIKKAQNRKSAKRFREAQKRRWQALQDELARHRRLVDELRAALAAAPARRVSIDALVAPAPTALADAEAALYAQLLCSAAPAGGRPYVAELGMLARCVVASRNGVVRSTRRGAPLPPGAHLIRDVSALDATSVRNALAAADAVAVGYVRGGTRYNAVVKPVPGGDDVLLAEFIPFNSPL